MQINLKKWCGWFGSPDTIRLAACPCNERIVDGHYFTAVASISTRNSGRARRDSHQRTGVAPARGNETFQQDIPIGDESFDVRCEDMNAHDIGYVAPASLENLLNIVENAIKLAAVIADVKRLAVRVDRNLAGTVEDALGAGHLMSLYEAESVLPFRWIDDFSVHDSLQ